MAHVSPTFVNATLWPEFEELAAALESHLDQTTDDIIQQALAGDTSEPEELAGLLENEGTRGFRTSV